jgi:hypothetical protein
MASIPIQNETDYPLTDAMMQYILRDAQEHFGEEVRSIRVQSGLARHALNARTREVRYAFFPQDFGLAHPMPMVPEPLDPLAVLPIIDQVPEDAILPTAFEDIEDGEDVEDMEVEEEDSEPLETSLESLDEGRHDEEDDDDFFKLDDPVEDADEDEEDNIFDQEEDEEE